VRQFFRGVLLVGLAITAALSVAVGSLSLWYWYKSVQVESFYQENRLLGKMRAVQKNWSNDSAPAREVLLETVPLKTDGEAAVAVLRKEGLVCQTIVEGFRESRLRQKFLDARELTNIPNNGWTRKDRVDCQTLVPNGFGYVRFIVDLEFAADGHLSDARVAIWNIFL
jgi:hypothetical protein